MHVHEQPEDRRRADLQIRGAYIFTLTGFFMMVLLLFMCITPIAAHGVWPLLERPKTSTGHKVVEAERDLFVSVTADGTLFVHETPATFDMLVEAMRASRRPVRVRRNYFDGPYDVYVRVDKRAPFRAVREVVRAAQAAGLTQLTFTAARPHDDFDLDYD